MGKWGNGEIRETPLKRPGTTPRSSGGSGGLEHRGVVPSIPPPGMATYGCLGWAHVRARHGDVWVSGVGWGVHGSADHPRAAGLPV